MVKKSFWDYTYNKAINWMLVSFMTLPPDQQLSYFEGPLLNQDDKDYSNPSKNYLCQLTSSLLTYDLYHEFEPDDNIFEKSELFKASILNESPKDKVYCYESFMNSTYWSDIRLRAKELLDATGLGIYPEIPKPIIFDYLIEIVY